MTFESHLYPEYVLRGPYTSNQNRHYLTAIHRQTKKRKSILYNRFVMETHLGRLLTSEETVDHDDRDTLNDDISNLKILPLGEHKSLDVYRNKDQAFICPVCHTEFVLSGRKLSAARWKNSVGRKGPFCSQLCGSKAANHKEDYEYVRMVVEKYSLKDEGKQNDSGS